MFVRLSVRESSSLKWWCCVMWRCLNVFYQAHGNAQLKPRAPITNMLQRNWDAFDSTATLYLVVTRFLSCQKLPESLSNTKNTGFGSDDYHLSALDGTNAHAHMGTYTAQENTRHKHARPKGREGTRRDPDENRS